MTISYQPAPEAIPPSTAPRFSGLAWAALILGIVGVIGSPIIIFNNITAIAAGVGVILGLIALFGSKKLVAALGVGISILAIVFTVSVQSAVTEELDKVINGSTNKGQVSDGTSGAAPAAGPQENTAAWGNRYTWSNKLAIEVSTPARCSPGNFASPTKIERAVKFTITVVNNTTEPFSTGMLSGLSEAQFNSHKAEQVLFGDKNCTSSPFESATVLPGKTYRYDMVYAVSNQPGEMQLVFQPGFSQDRAVFSGPA